MKLPILEKIKTFSEEIFAQNLVGIYVHGSIAFGCYNPEKSDVDYIIVLKEPPTEDERVRYMQELLALNREAPAKGIEMSIVLLKYTQKFVYPTPYELHFSNSHLDRAQRDLKEYCETMRGTDPDLAAHFTVTKKAGIVLFGPPIDEVFSPVPRKSYLDSICLDIENAADDILKDPIYVILNLCRVLAYLNEEIVISKADGGKWGMQKLPERFVPTVKKALDSYTSQYDLMISVTKDELLSFAGYMLGEISKLR